MNKSLSSDIGNPQSLRVLVIEDSEDDVLLVIRELKKSGYHLVYERIETAPEMLKALREKQWDIILCDYNLPKFSAPAAIKLLKEEKADIPLIVISGTIGEEKAVECMRSGAHDYIMKGSYSRLCPAIDRELEEVKSRKQQKQSENQKRAALEALRKSEELYTKLVNTIPDGIICNDLNGNIFFVNDNTLRISGYSREDFIGHNLLKFIVPEYHDDAIIFFQTMLKSRVGPHEYPMITKEGRIIPFEVHADILRNKDGSAFGVVSLGRDLTERKRTEKIIQDNEKRLLGISKNLPGVIFQFYVRDDGEYGINYVSEPRGEFSKIMENLDLSYGDNLFQLFLSRIHKDDRDSFITSIETAVKNTSNWNFEGRVELLSGKNIWLQGLSTPTRYENQTIFNGILLNITERKMAEEQSRLSEDKFYKIFMTTPDCIALTRLNDGQFIDVNKGFEDIVGWKRELAIGQKSTGPPFFFLTDESELDFIKKELQAGRDILHREFKFKRSDGSERFGNYSARSITINEQQCLIFIMQDITERKLLDAELKRTLEVLRKSVGTTIQVMVSAIEMRDPYTAGHQLRVADLARAIATEMHLSSHTIDGIRMAGTIHDIGKLSIPAEILTKPSKLTKIEYSIVQEHAKSGYDILKNIESPWPLAEMVYQHHERINGSGYPRNLRGNEIIPEARILAVADVVEAMASHRPYRASLGIEFALAEIEKNKGMLYDETVVDACMRLFRDKGYVLT